ARVWPRPRPLRALDRRPRRQGLSESHRPRADALPGLFEGGKPRAAVGRTPSDRAEDVLPLSAAAGARGAECGRAAQLTGAVGADSAGAQPRERGKAAGGAAAPGALLSARPGALGDAVRDRQPRVGSGGAEA